MLSCPHMLVSMDWVKLTHIGVCEMLLSRMCSLGRNFSAFWYFEIKEHITYSTVWQGYFLAFGPLVCFHCFESCWCVGAAYDALHFVIVLHYYDTHVPIKYFLLQTLVVSSISAVLTVQLLPGKQYWLRYKII